VSAQDTIELTARERAEVDDMVRALESGVTGWNVRCNVCGAFGALWRRDPETRTATGDLAACVKCYGAIKKEIERHRKEVERHVAEIQALAVVRFPIQPTAKAQDQAFTRSCETRGF
jgi:hypothetical protein